jgi:hypothetical protein
MFAISPASYHWLETHVPSGVLRQAAEENRNRHGKESVNGRDGEQIMSGVPSFDE